MRVTFCEIDVHKRKCFSSSLYTRQNLGKNKFEGINAGIFVILETVLLFSSDSANSTNPGNGLMLLQNDQ